MTRLQLEAEIVEADAAEWQPGTRFDGVLLDAPCLSTGTIRRHPDILHLKRESDLERLITLQARLLDNAARLVKPGGLLVYCTCSLEPEEGPQQIERFSRGQTSLRGLPSSLERQALRPSGSRPTATCAPSHSTCRSSQRPFPGWMAFMRPACDGGLAGLLPSSCALCHSFHKSPTSHTPASSPFL